MKDAILPMKRHSDSHRECDCGSEPAAAITSHTGAYPFGVDTVLCGEGEASVPLFVVDR